MNVQIFLSSLTHQERNEIHSILTGKHTVQDFMDTYRDKMSSRLYNCLRGALGYGNFMPDYNVFSVSINDLMKMRNMGKKSWKEFESLVNDYRGIFLK